MARDIILGNGQLFVALDKWLQVRDIFFPHVGQYNHLKGHAHKIAILEDTSISWVNTDDWQRDLKYKKDILISDCTAKGRNLTIRFEDGVYCEDNIFFRKITVKNEANYKRKIRVCFKHDFHLYADGIGDTALYSLKHKAIIHYKRSTYFLIGVCHDKKSIMSDYAVGEYVEPSFRLSKNPIAQGNVNSMIAVDLELESGEEQCIDYYMCAGKTFEDVYSLQESFVRRGGHRYIQDVMACEGGFLNGIKPNISLLDEDLQDKYRRSILVMKAHMDKDGAIIASNDSDTMQFNKDTYSYMWPRDGALVAISLIKAGYAHMTRKFFEFCKDVLYVEGCLLHKYNPDKTLGSSWHPWMYDDQFSLPIQEDETALVLHALWVYYEHTQDKRFVKDMYKDLIKPMGEFLVKYRYENGLPKESYDLWEERRGVFTYTTATVLAGIKAAHKLGNINRDEKLCSTCIVGFESIKRNMLKYLYNDEKGYFRRSVSFEDGKITFDEAMDSSVYALFAYEAFNVNEKEVVSTMKKMREWLTVRTPVGGIARYYNDFYQRVSDDVHQVPGNPWFICTLWYAKWLIKSAREKRDLESAKRIIDWAAKHSLNTGLFAEQLHPFTGEPLSVSPLTWSHAEFVDTITDYVNRLEEFG